MRLERLSLEEWSDALPSSGFEVFHTPEALAVLDEHSRGRLELLGAFKGDRPVALVPVSVRSLPIGRVITSPPPGMGVPRLGPVVMPASPKRSKREKVNGAVAELLAEELELDDRTTLFQMECGPSFNDPRPYVWREFNLETRFTYRLDTADADPDDLLRDASKSLRREIRDARDLDVTIERGGIESAKTIFRQTQDRYEEQGRTLSLDWPYVRDLVSALDERARVYVARDPNGEPLSGITVLYSNDVAYFWQGGIRAVYEGTAVNSLLHWRIVEDLVEDPPKSSISGYDLFGANTERLCQYKSKFGATLTPYYVVETSGPAMQTAKRAYELATR